MSTLESKEDVVLDAQLAIERRDRSDRRNPTFKGFLIGCIKARRRQQRRADCFEHYETDWYDTKLLVMALTLLLLSATDAAMTMTLLENGAVEVNPFMNFLLSHSSQAFIYTKLAMTSVCIVVLVAHYHSRIFNSFRVDILLMFALFVYMGLVTYEFYLFFTYVI